MFSYRVLARVDVETGAKSIRIEGTFNNWGEHLAPSWEEAKELLKLLQKAMDEMDKASQ